MNQQSRRSRARPLRGFAHSRGGPEIPRGGIRFFTVGAVAMAMAACVGDRERPDPTGLPTPADLDLTVELVSPTTEQSPLIAGRNLEVRVRASEPGRRLEGLGYEIRRVGFQNLLQSDEVAFPPTTDREHTFVFTVPEDLPDHTLLNVRAVSVGQGDVREVTDPPTLLTVVQCNQQPWCS